MHQVPANADPSRVGLAGQQKGQLGGGANRMPPNPEGEKRAVDSSMHGHFDWSTVSLVTRRAGDLSDVRLSREGLPDTMRVRRSHSGRPTVTQARQLSAFTLQAITCFAIH